MKIKQIIKILSINITIILILLISLEFVFFNVEKHKLHKKLRIYKEMTKNDKMVHCNDLRYSFQVPSFNYKSEKSFMRKPEGLEYKKPPIILFGCSFVFGYGLSNNDTFSHKLSLFSKRPVYNRAMPGWGLQHMLYQLKREDFYNEVKPPEYVIYTFIPDHINRLYRYQYPPPNNYILLRYKITEKGFEEIQPFFRPLWSLYTVNYVQSWIENDILTAKSNTKNNYDFFCLMMEECKKLIMLHYPKAKIVILMYKEYPYMENDYAYLREKLTQDGFTVINTSELLKNDSLYGDKYKAPDQCHPSGLAWDLIVPALIKKLNL